MHFTDKLYGLNLLNPHLLLIDIIDEIKFNDLKNKENRKYFYSLIDFMYKNDPAIQNKYQSDFSLLRREFNNSKNPYTLQLCEAMKKGIFENGNYYRELCNSLYSILTNNNWVDSDELRLYLISQHLIVELLLGGFSLDRSYTHSIALQDLPRNVFDKYKLIGDHLVTKYPHTINSQDYIKGGFLNRQAYNQAIIDEIDNIKVAERIKRFETFYDIKTIDCIMIFRVEGIIGYETDFNIGNVNFYSPLTKQYISTQTVTDSIHPEYFGDKEGPDYINAAVKVAINQNDIKASKSRVCEQIEKALDLLRCYVQSTTRFEVNKEEFVLANLEQKQIASGRETTNKIDWFKKKRSINLDGVKLEKIIDRDVLNKANSFLFLPSDQQSELERKISYSLHWYRKGSESDTLEDKLLNYWIVIENLMNLDMDANAVLKVKDQQNSKFYLIREFMTSLEVLYFIFDYGWELYYYLEKLISISQFTNRGIEHPLNLPDDLIIKCNLRPENNSTIELKSLIDNLDEISTHANRKIIVEKINSTKRFYTENDYAKKVILERISAVRDDITKIYMYRNRIVHNAHFDNSILPYYVPKAKKFAGEQLGYIIKQYSSNRDISLKQINMNYYVKLNRIMEKLDSPTHLDFLDLKL